MLKQQKGFTLIELLVVIAILGVIAAVVALNVNNFFGRGTLQAANTELHQVQTAIVACMAECETSTLNMTGESVWWVGQEGIVLAACERSDGSNDAAYYLYGSLRAAYEVNDKGQILNSSTNKEDHPEIDEPWVGLYFCGGDWRAEPCT